MAKRGAEKQLTQDNVDEDERQEEVRALSSTSSPRCLNLDGLTPAACVQGGSGEFRKASGDALQGRK
jgi:hypothetical protein